MANGHGLAEAFRSPGSGPRFARRGRLPLTFIPFRYSLDPPTMDMFNGTMTTRSELDRQEARTFGPQSEIEVLRRENFNLKVRVYMLERDRTKLYQDAQGDVNMQFSIKHELNFDKEPSVQLFVLLEETKKKLDEAKSQLDDFVQRLKVVLTESSSDYDLNKHFDVQTDISPNELVNCIQHALATRVPSSDVETVKDKMIKDLRIDLENLRQHHEKERKKMKVVICSLAKEVQALSKSSKKDSMLDPETLMCMDEPSLNATFEALRQDHEAKEIESAERQKLMREIESLMEENSSKQSMIVNLEQKYQVTSAMYSQLAGEMEMKEADIAVLKDSLNEMDELRMQISDMKAIYENAPEREQLTVDQERIVEEATSVPDDLALQERVLDLEKQLQEANEQKMTIFEQYDNLKDHLEKLAIFMKRMIEDRLRPSDVSSVTSEFLSEASNYLEETLHVSQTLQRSISNLESFDSTELMTDSFALDSFRQSELPAPFYLHEQKTEDGSPVLSTGSKQLDNCFSLTDTNHIHKRRRRWSSSSPRKPHVSSYLDSQLNYFDDNNDKRLVSFSGSSEISLIKMHDLRKMDIESISGSNHPVHKVQSRNFKSHNNVSSDSDIWSEPDREVSVQRVGIQMKSPLKSPAQKRSCRKKLYEEHSSDHGRTECRSRRKRSSASVSQDVSSQPPEREMIQSYDIDTRTLIFNLKAELEKANFMIRACKRQIISYKASFEAADSLQRRLTSELAKTKEKLLRLDQKCKRYEMDVAQFRDKKVTEMSQESTCQRPLQTDEALCTVTDHLNTIQKLKQDNDESDGIIEHLKDKNIVLEKRAALLRQEIAKRLGSIASRKSDSMITRGVTKKLQMIRRDSETSVSQKAILQQEIDDACIIQAYDELVSELNLTQASLQDSEAANTALAAKISKLEEAALRKEGVIKAMQELLTKTEELVAQRNAGKEFPTAETIEEYENEILTLKNTIAESKSQLRKMAWRKDLYLVAKTVLIQRLNTEVSDKLKQIQELRNKVESLNAQLNIAQEQLSQEAKETEEENDTVENLQTTINQLDLQLKARDLEIMTLKEKHDSLKHQNGVLELEKKENSEKIYELKNDLQLKASIVDDKSRALEESFRRISSIEKLLPKPPSPSTSDEKDRVEVPKETFERLSFLETFYNGHRNCLDADDTSRRPLKKVCKEAAVQAVLLRTSTVNDDVTSALQDITMKIEIAEDVSRLHNEVNRLSSDLYNAQLNNKQLSEENYDLIDQLETGRASIPTIPSTRNAESEPLQPSRDGSDVRCVVQTLIKNLELDEDMAKLKRKISELTRKRVQLLEENAKLQEISSKVTPVSNVESQTFQVPQNQVQSQTSRTLLASQKQVESQTSRTLLASQKQVESQTSRTLLSQTEVECQTSRTLLASQKDAENQTLIASQQQAASQTSRTSLALQRQVESQTSRTLLASQKQAESQTSRTLLASQKDAENQTLMASQQQAESQTSRTSLAMQRQVESQTSRTSLVSQNEVMSQTSKTFLVSQQEAQSQTIELERLNNYVDSANNAMKEILVKLELTEDVSKLQNQINELTVKLNTVQSRNKALKEENLNLKKRKSTSDVSTKTMQDSQIAFTQTDQVSETVSRPDSQAVITQTEQDLNEVTTQTEQDSETSSRTRQDLHEEFAQTEQNSGSASTQTSRNTAKAFAQTARLDVFDESAEASKVMEEILQKFDLADNVAQFRRRISDLNVKLQSAVSMGKQHEAQKADLQKQLVEKDTFVQSIERRRKQMQSVAAQVTAPKVKQIAKSSQADLENIMAEVNGTVQKLLRKLEFAEDIAKLHDEINDLGAKLHVARLQNKALETEKSILLEEISTKDALPESQEAVPEKREATVQATDLDLDALRENAESAAITREVLRKLELEADIANLQMEINDLNDKLKSTEFKYEDLELENVNLRQQLEDEKQAVQRTTPVSDDVDDGLNDIMDKLKLQELVANLQHENASMSTKIEELESTIEKLQERVTKFQEMAEESSSEVVGWKEKQLADESKLSEILRSLDSKDVCIRDLMTEKSELESYIDELEKQLGEAQKDLFDTKAELADVQDGYSKKSVQCEQLQNDLLENTKLLGDTQARLEDTEARLDDTQARLDDTQVRLDDAQVRLDDTMQRMSYLEERLANNASDSSQLSLEMADRIEKHKLELDDKSVLIKRLRDELETKSNYILKANDEIEQKTRDVRILEEDVKRLVLDIERLKDDVKTLEDDREIQAVDRRRQADGLVKKLEAAGNLLQLKEETIQRLQMDIETLKEIEDKTSSQVMLQLQDRAKDIQYLDEQVAAKSTHIDELVKEMSQMNEQYNRVVNKLKDNNVEMDRKQKEINAMKEKLSKLDKEQARAIVKLESRGTQKVLEPTPAVVSGINDMVSRKWSMQKSLLKLQMKMFEYTELSRGDQAKLMESVADVHARMIPVSLKKSDPSMRNVEFDTEDMEKCFLDTLRSDMELLTHLKNFFKSFVLPWVKRTAKSKSSTQEDSAQKYSSREELHTGGAKGKDTYRSTYSSPDLGIDSDPQNQIDIQQLEGDPQTMWWDRCPMLSSQDRKRFTLLFQENMRLRQRILELLAEQKETKRALKEHDRKAQEQKKVIFKALAKTDKVLKKTKVNMEENLRKS